MKLADQMEIPSLSMSHIIWKVSYSSFLQWLGIPKHTHADLPPPRYVNVSFYELFSHLFHQWWHHDQWPPEGWHPSLLSLPEKWKSCTWSSWQRKPPKRFYSMYFHRIQRWLLFHFWNRISKVNSIKIIVIAKHGVIPLCVAAKTSACQSQICRWDSAINRKWIDVGYFWLKIWNFQ